MCFELSSLYILECKIENEKKRKKKYIRKELNKIINLGERDGEKPRVLNHLLTYSAVMLTHTHERHIRFGSNHSGSENRGR